MAKQNKELIKLELGEWAKWRSQASGSHKEKVGFVALVVSAFHIWREVKWHTGIKLELVPSQGGRDHESYVFEVQTGKNGAKKRYWPNVSALKKCEPVAGIGVKVV